MNNKTTKVSDEQSEILDNNKEPKKKKSVLRIIGDIVFWALVGFFVTVFVCNGIDQHTNYSLPLFGYRQSVVISPSMSYANEENTYLTEDMQRIYKNDVILTKNYKSYDDIKLYDVLTYASPNGLICHRVIEKYESEGKQYLITRGDANNVSDEPISYSAVRGKVIKVTHGIGGFVLFVQSPYFAIGVCSSLFFIFLGTFIYDYEHDKKKGKKEEAVVLPEVKEDTSVEKKHE